MSHIGDADGQRRGVTLRSNGGHVEVTRRPDGEPGAGTQSREGPRLFTAVEPKQQEKNVLMANISFTNTALKRHCN